MTAANFRAAFSKCFWSNNKAEYPIQYVDSNMNMKEELLANKKEILLKHKVNIATL